MIVDLRYAAGLPVNAGAIIGICIGLYRYSRMSDETPSAPLWALHQALSFMVMGAVVSLLFVLPNVGAAALSNHFAAHAHWLVYSLAFIAICTAIFWLETKLLGGMFRNAGGIGMRLTDRKTLALILADIALCLAAAHFYPQAAA